MIRLRKAPKDYRCDACRREAATQIQGVVLNGAPRVGTFDLCFACEGRLFKLLYRRRAGQVMPKFKAVKI